MRKYLLIIILFLPLILSANTSEVAYNDLNIKGLQAYNMNDYGEAFCLFDIQLVYFRKDEDALERLEAQIGRFCAAYYLGYYFITENDFYLIYSLKYKTQTVKDLLVKYPNSMLNEAIEIVGRLKYARDMD